MEIWKQNVFAAIENIKKLTRWQILIVESKRNHKKFKRQIERKFKLQPFFGTVYDQFTDKI